MLTRRALIHSSPPWVRSQGSHIDRVGVFNEGRVSSFHNKIKKGDRANQKENRGVKNKKSASWFAALSVGCSGLDGSRNRGSFAAIGVFKKKACPPCDPLYLALEAATGELEEGDTTK